MAMEIARPTTEISTLANQSAGLNLIYRLYLLGTGETLRGLTIGSCKKVLSCNLPITLGVET